MVCIGSGLQFNLQEIHTPWNLTAGIRLLALGFRETIIFQPSILGAKLLVSGRAIQQKIRILAPDELDLQNKNRLFKKGGAPAEAIS